MRRLILFLLAASVAIASAPAAFAGSVPAFVRQTDIPAPDGRWDFVNWDSEHERLLVAHGQDVLMMDPAPTPVVRAIGKIEGAHAVLAIPGTNRILVTSGHDDSVRILDGGNGAQVASIAVPTDPDAAILSADGHMAYVMAAKAGMVSVIDLDSLRELRRIALKPGLEVPVLVDSHLLAVNNEDAGEIELVDPDAGKALGAIALPDCEGPTGMAYSLETGLALSACANGKAALVDLAKRKLVRLVPIGLGPDTAIWQAKEHRFLVPCGKAGALSIISLDGVEEPVVTDIPTEPSARTAALDQASGRLFLPAARFLPATAGKRGAMEPGSFHIVVMSPGR